MKSKLEIVEGNIIEISADAIVNSNNTYLISGEGEGVNGVVIEKGGARIIEECKKIRVQLGVVPPGEAVITTAGDLPFKNVIHAIGPVWQGGSHKEELKLTDCYENSLKLAVENGIKTIAFPNISTGSYGFPKEIAAEISVGTVLWFLRQEDGKKLDKVTFVCHNKENYELCKKEYDNAK